MELGRKRVQIKLDTLYKVSDTLEVNLSPTDSVQIGERVPITFIHPPEISG